MFSTEESDFTHILFDVRKTGTSDKPIVDSAWLETHSIQGCHLWILPSPITSYQIYHDEKRRWIDEKIAELEAEIHRLKLQRNELSVAHNLPTDIVSVIAAVYKDLTAFTGRGSWLNILGVCTRWRRLIVDLPAFWATISSDDRPIVKKMIQRSDHTPLRLHYRLRDTVNITTWDLFWRAVLFASSGTRGIDAIALTCAIDYPLFFNYLCSMLDKNPKATGSIRTFRLIRESLGSGDLPDLPAPCRLVPQILVKSMTSLRSLELIDFLVPPDIPPLPSLTNLDISCSPNPHGLSVNWVVGMLEQTPNVEYINMGIISDTDMPETEDLQVSLSSLKVLNVEMNYLEAFKLFDFLNLPNHPRITVTLLSSDRGHVVASGDTLPPHALSATRFSQAMSGFRLIPLDKVSIHRDEFFGEFKLHLYSPGDDFPFLNVDLPTQCFELHHYTDWFSSSSLSLESVTELTINDNTLRIESSSPLAWADFLILFTGLKVLHLRNIQPNELPTILRSILGSEHSTGSLFRSLPPVETISFSSIDWSSLPRAGSSYQAFFGVPDSSTTTTRSNDTNKRLKLVITKCTIEAEQVDALRQHVEVEHQENIIFTRSRWKLDKIKKLWEKGILYI
ncbi:hypothetical protein ONZ45_g18643 [Pleurotus djamor]|nr:hypothetical protein ONZ45_g18643 [Pleurotus djamor]